MQLRRYTHVHINIERIMMRYKRARRRAACRCLQHGRFDFHKTLRVKIVAHFLYNTGPGHESLAYFWVNDQIYITLAVTHILILEPMEFFGQRKQRFGQQLNLLRMYRNLSRLCFEYKAGYPDDVADIELFKRSVLILADVVAADIDLDLALAVHNMGKARFAHNPL
ncbi:hypothetical protein SDC9_206067 [bioreactor metagenome]|uniref:Uncharacterized protein n=1 Tax=bioreactor metagenome TaxID=1076179 RepID=A0A645JFI9_9ZZZZ